MFRLRRACFIFANLYVFIVIVFILFFFRYFFVLQLYGSASRVRES